MSHDLSPLGFRKTPSTRELQVRECFPLEPQAQVAAALTEAVAGAHERRTHRSRGTGKTVALRMLVQRHDAKFLLFRDGQVAGLEQQRLGADVLRVERRQQIFGNHVAQRHLLSPCFWRTRGGSNKIPRRRIAGGTGLIDSATPALLVLSLQAQPVVAVGIVCVLVPGGRSLVV